LQQLGGDILNTEAHLFDSPVATRWHGISRGATRGHQLFIGQNPLSMSQVPPDNSPTEAVNMASVNYYLNAHFQKRPGLKIEDLEGKNTFTALLENSPGIHRFRWAMRFDPSEEHKKEFRKQQEIVFSQLKKGMDKDQIRVLDKLYTEFKSAQTPEELNAIREKLIENFRNLAPRRRFFGVPLQGLEALPGTYRLTLTANGKVYTHYLSIRKDPLLRE